MKLNLPCLVWPLFLLLTSAVCGLADEPRLVLNTGGHTSIITKVIFTRDGKYLISAGQDKVIRVWEVETGRLARTIQGEIGEGNEGVILAMALSPDERYLAIGGWLAGGSNDSAAIRLHDFRSGAVVGLLYGHDNVTLALAFSPDGRYLVSGSADKTARVWDLDSGQMKEAHPPLRGHTDLIDAVAVSPDGRRIVTGSFDKTLRLWDAATGTLVGTLDKKHNDKVRSAAFSPDGIYLVSGGDDGSVLLWDAEAGGFIRELHRKETSIDSLSFSRDGSRLLTGSAGGSIPICYVLDFPSGAVIRRFEKHDDIVLAAAFSPNGNLVATAGGNQKLIYLWNPDDGHLIRTLAGQGQTVWSVAFARDGQSIALGNEHTSDNDNHFGPLQRSVSLGPRADYQLTVGAVRDEASFERGLTKVGVYSLRRNIGPDQNLQIVRNGKAKRPITIDSTRGFANRCSTLTRNGQQVVSGGDNGFLALYETQTGTKVRYFIGHIAEVCAVAVSPDNRTLVSGSADQTVRLWDIASGRNLLTIFVGIDNEWVAWTPEGYYTASLNGDRYIGWHVNHGVDKAADYYSAAQFKAQFYRPDVVSEYLRTRDIKLAVKTAEERRGLRLGAGVSPATPNILALRPPVPYFIEPEEDNAVKETDSDLFRVRAAAKKPDSGAPDVASITLLLNGSSQGTVQDWRLEMHVHLQPGENTLAVIATNTEKVPSQPAVIKINYTGQSQSRKPKIIFLGIGVAEYQRTGRELRYADQDVTRVKQLFLSQQNNGVFGEVLTQVLTNRDVNRDTVLDKLEWIKQKSGQDDLVVLFLSGHGGLFENDYYFYTYQHDGAADYERYDVNWRILIRALNSIKARHAVLFVDTCHAGALGKSKGDEGLAKVLRDFKNSSPGLLVFAASGANELSREMDGNGDRTYGVFTYALIKCLEGQAGIVTKDGAIYTDQLGAWLATEVPKLNPDQHPEYTKPELPGFNHFALFVLPRR